MMMRVFMRLPIQIMGMGIGMMTIISSHFAMIKEEGGDYNFTGASPVNWQERERGVEQIKQNEPAISIFSPRNTTNWQQ